jgi:hypothetical protein
MGGPYGRESGPYNGVHGAGAFGAVPVAWLVSGADRAVGRPCGRPALRSSDRPVGWSAYVTLTGAAATLAIQLV